MKNIEIKKIVFEVLDNLCEKKGFAAWWYNLDNETEKNIEDDLFEIVKKRIDKNLVN